MRAGKLRHFVTIQAPPAIASKDTFGGPSGSWTTFRQLWADVGGESGGERFDAATKTSVVRTPIECRFVDAAGITAAMRVVNGAEVYQIRAVRDPDGRRERVILDCDAVGSEPT